jgi:hypothetical protein
VLLSLDRIDTRATCQLESESLINVLTQRLSLPLFPSLTLSFSVSFSLPDRQTRNKKATTSAAIVFSFTVISSSSFDLSMSSWSFLFVFIFALRTSADRGAAAVPPAYNYHEYRSQQTPSSYANKRHHGSATYVDQQYPSSPPSSYGNTVARSAAANQCKLHINCPSKFTSYRNRTTCGACSGTKSSHIGHSRTSR